MKWTSGFIIFLFLLLPAMGFAGSIYQKYDSSQRYKGYDYYYRLRQPVKKIPMETYDRGRKSYRKQTVKPAPDYRDYLPGSDKYRYRDRDRDDCYPRHCKPCDRRRRY